MKILKGFIYFVLIMVASALLAAVFAPAQKTVSRHIEINASQKIVFNQIANFENWKNWDAWFTKDTLQIRTYYGTINDKVYGYTWSSENKDVGAGKLEMNAVTGMDQLSYTFYFEDRPNKGSFSLRVLADKTKVVWQMYSDLDYPFKILNYFIDPMVGPDFEEGLKNLKTVSENMPIALEGEIQG
ncbi:MAG: SRPBCC family protein [Bacteroidia bacterium]|jgi:hypothetical protein|nr:SRPBCC family protein [Bacteroidia bacterium]